MRRSRVAEYTERHGLRRTFVHFCLGTIRRLSPSEVIRVFAADGKPTGDGQVAGYVTREVKFEEVRTGRVVLPGECARDVALRRGDRCFANCLGDEIVGYTLYSRHGTRIREGLELRIPDGFEYGYASYTAPAHRGRGLALARSDTRKRSDLACGRQRSTIWYVAVDNDAGLAALSAVQSRVIGHLAYARVAGRFLVAASPGARRFGVSLVAISDKPRTSEEVE